MKEQKYIFRNFWNSFWSSFGIFFGILFGIVLGILFGILFGILMEILLGICLGLNFSAGGVCGCAVVGKEKFDLMTGGGGDKYRSLEARDLRTLALKNECSVDTQPLKNRDYIFFSITELFRFLFEVVVFNQERLLYCT